MNILKDVAENPQKELKFPSPTGVNYYEYVVIRDATMLLIMFPSPTGVNYYELNRFIVK